jgi:hypothetical protein
MDSPNAQPAMAALNERDRRLHPRYTVQVQIERASVLQAKE